MTPFHAKFWAYELTRRAPADSVDRLATALVDAQVDLNPHQIDAALFAFRSPLSKGVLLADEVGLGKTIEAGLVISQKWAERRRRLLVVTPSNLRKQWHQELSEKFFLPCSILESKPYNGDIKQGRFRTFERDAIVICSYQFARNKAADISAVPWDLVVMDEAHRLRNVYKPGNVIANTLKQALAQAPKLLLTAMPLQNSLLELFGLVSILDEQVFGDLRSFREQYHWRLVNLKDAFAASIGKDWKTTRSELADRVEPRLERFVLDNATSVVRTARVAPKDVSEVARGALEQSRTAIDRVFPVVRGEQDVIYFLNGEQLIFYSAKVRMLDGELCTVAPATNIWDDLLSNNLHNEGGVSFPNGKKPEALVKRLLELSTESNDLVLDSFAGSGTTGSVAHKMGRRWIMIELGAHAETHIVPRLRKVIDGQDPSGITKAAQWKGGGGFRYYKLAPSLLERDKWGNWAINKDYNAAMLAEALCKLEGFTYQPSESIAWQHGHSTERDFLYVTTQTLTEEQLRQLSEEVGPERSLLVLCTAFRGSADAFANLTIKKIPKTVLSRCEWGRDDYSLEVQNLSAAPPASGQQGLFEK